MKKKTDLKDSCASCSVINCADLFRHTKDNDEFTGGELYVYKQLTHPRIMEEDLGKYICSNAALLQCACFIIGTVSIENPDHYLTNICFEVVRDMKASFFLAMSGHYRQAILIQRCVFENFLYGLYFHSENCYFATSDDDEKRVQKNFNAWIDGNFRKSEEYLLDIICRGKLITKAEEKEWRALFGQLSQFIHTIRHTPTGKAIKYNDIKFHDCVSEVEFNKESLIEWSIYYQRLFFLILHKMLLLYPSVKKEQAGILALKMIRAEFRPIKQELNNQSLNALLRMRTRKAI